MTVKIFNPDHDLAIAENKDSFIPPATAAKMAEDMSLLPYWYSESDTILAAQDMSAIQKEAIQLLGISNKIVCNPAKAGLPEDANAEPWGWNRSIVRKLNRMGISSTPDGTTLDRIRSMSSREFSIRLLERLNKIDGTCGERKAINDPDELNRIFENSTNYILKSLWSSSGKGILWCRDRLFEQVRKRAESDIRKYGGVTFEPIYEKEVDFAMEFHSKKGNTRFIGYSLFRTNIYGVYESNDIKSDELIEEELAMFADRETLEKIKLGITGFIEDEIAPFYTGPLGIDMMICKGSDGRYMVHPCVEINLRMNMGIVCHEIRNRIVDSRKTGKFFIGYSKDPSGLRETDTRYRNEYPLVIRNGKIVSGYLALTPVYKNTEYTAYIIIDA